MMSAECSDSLTPPPFESIQRHINIYRVVHKKVEIRRGTLPGTLGVPSRFSSPTLCGRHIWMVPYYESPAKRGNDETSWIFVNRRLPETGQLWLPDRRGASQKCKAYSSPNIERAVTSAHGGGMDCVIMTVIAGVDSN